MSDASRSTNPRQPRPLRANESLLLNALLGGEFREEPHRRTSGLLVQDMADGKMGSIRILGSSSSERRFASVICEADYVDEDGVLVSISANADQHGQLLEVDFWKVDFSPLIRYPSPDELRPKTTSRSGADSESKAFAHL